MPEQDTTVVLKVECGKVLKTTVNGAPVEIVCGSAPADTNWTPTPITGDSGYAAFEIVTMEDAIDLDVAVERIRNDDLGDDLRPTAF